MIVQICHIIIVLTGSEIGKNYVV